MEIFCTLVGTHFRGSEAKKLVNDFTPGTVVELIAEPDNEYDANAVACYYNDQHVGYLSRDNNEQVANHLAEVFATGMGDEKLLTAEVIDFDNRHPVLQIHLP